MRLVLEDDDGEELDALDLEAEGVYMLHSDISAMSHDSPDYPNAWSDRNLNNFNALVELLDQEQAKDAYFTALEERDS